VFNFFTVFSFPVCLRHAYLPTGEKSGLNSTIADSTSDTNVPERSPVRTRGRALVTTSREGPRTVRVSY
jgi:hypothetical protein